MKNQPTFLELKSMLDVCQQAFNVEDMPVFNETSKEIQNNIATNNGLSTEEKTILGEQISKLIFLFGEKAYENNNILDVATKVNNLRSLVMLFPESLVIATNFLSLFVGFLEMRFVHRNFIEAEIYTKEIIELSGRFPKDEWFVFHCMACLVNLINISMNIMTDILDSMGILYQNFSDSEDILVAYCRGLVFFCCWSKFQLNDYLSEKYQDVLSQVFKEKAKMLPPNTLWELRDNLEDANIYI